VSPGRSTKFKLTISRTGGFAEAIGLSVSGLPAGASGSWNQNPATNASVLTVTAASTTPAGSYTVTVSGTSTSTHVAHSVTATLRVSAIADQQWTDVESTWRPLAGELRHDD